MTRAAYHTLRPNCATPLRSARCFVFFRPPCLRPARRFSKRGSGALFAHGVRALRFPGRVQASFFFPSMSVFFYAQAFGLLDKHKKIALKSSP